MNPEFERSSKSTQIDKLPKLKLVKTNTQAEFAPHLENSPKSLPFDRQVILQQSSTLSRLILWSLLTVTIEVIFWACVAKIEQAIPATGKLEPTGTVKEVQSPIDGVVKAIYVADGQKVRKGDRLLSFDPTAVKSQNAALNLVRNSLLQENQFYRSQMNNNSDATLLYPGIAAKTAIISLTKSRVGLVAENRLYRGLLGDSKAISHLDKEQIERL